MSEDRYLYLDDCLLHLKSRKRKIDDEIHKIKVEMEKIKREILDDYDENGVCPVKMIMSRVPPKPIITDKDSLPDRFIKIEKTINKGAINKAIKNGETIAGVSMDNGGVTLKIKGEK